jgi:hypothetical protein
MPLMYQRIKLLIVGGCFPVQDNIEPSFLYHQLLKKKLLELNNTNLEIKIIRYENISRCFEKIKEAINTEDPDWILFHLRVEPILLSSKLYSKYHDNGENLIKQINIAAFSWNFRKKKRITNKKITDSSLNRRLNIILRIRFLCREVNYLLGFVVGNWHYSFRDYLPLMIKIIELCKTNDKDLIITGPVSRPNSYLENQLSNKLHKFMGEYSMQHDQIYVTLMGNNDAQNNFLFCDDLIKVNEIGHQRISEILFKVIVHKKLSLLKRNKLEIIPKQSYTNEPAQA